MKVGFTSHAIARLRQVHAYVSADSPRNADALIDRIVSRAESLESSPLRGRQVPEYQRDDIREVLEHPYRIIYRVTASAVQVLTVMHERQLLPQDIVGLR